MLPFLIYIYNIMQLVKRTKDDSSYYDIDLIGKYIYLKQTLKETDILRIFKITKILKSKPITYEVIRQYYFCIPSNKDFKCYCYDSSDNVKLNNNDLIYIMSYDEYIDTFREFVKNDGCLGHNLPYKIVQDK